MTDGATEQMQKLIQAQLKRMDEDRDNARIDQQVRLSRMEYTMNEVKANTGKIFVWITGNGDPQSGLMQRTVNIEKLLEQHLIDCGEGGIIGARKRLEALEKANDERLAKTKDLKAKVYDLVKPVLGDIVKTIIVVVVLIMVFALTGQDVMKQILLLIS